MRVFNIIIYFKINHLRFEKFENDFQFFCFLKDTDEVFFKKKFSSKKMAGHSSKSIYLVEMYSEYS